MSQGEVRHPAAPRPERLLAGREPGGQGDSGHVVAAFAWWAEEVLAKHRLNRWPMTSLLPAWRPRFEHQQGSFS